MKKGVLYFICLILVILVTGVFWGTWFTLTRSLDQFPVENFIRIGKTIIANVADINALDVGHAALVVLDVPATAVLLFFPGVVNTYGN